MAQSAFFVRVPIEPQQILDVQVVEPRDFRPSVTLDDFSAQALEESAQKKT
jgi:hypothetical protein